jgi:hypothetical protein
VGKEEPEAGLGEHPFVDGFQLMREGLDAGEADGKVGVECMG